VVTASTANTTIPQLANRVVYSDIFTITSNAGAVLNQAPAYPASLQNSDTVRFNPTKGYQWYNPDTHLWHTKVCVGNPPQDGWDAGEP